MKAALSLLNCDEFARLSRDHRRSPHETAALYNQAVRQAHQILQDGGMTADDIRDTEPAECYFFVASLSPTRHVQFVRRPDLVIFRFQDGSESYYLGEFTTEELTDYMLLTMIKKAILVTCI